MPTLPSFRRRPRVDPAQAAIEAVAKALQDARPGATGARVLDPRQVNAAVGSLAQQFSKTPDEIEQSLKDQGLSWGPAFGPGRPLTPFSGYSQQPRLRDFPVGENVQITPRFGRISFETLKGIIDSYDVAQIAIRHIINDVRSLGIQFAAPAGVSDDVQSDIDQVRAFFRSPDQRLPFRPWLAKWMQDLLRYDAPALYRRRNEKGDIIALEVVSGRTIIPLTDYYGRSPASRDSGGVDSETDETPPAFLQIVQGLPWMWLTEDDILYAPLNPIPDSLYGLSPIEGVLLTANTDIRFQWHFLQYFCYDDQTEVLTREGWRRFDALDGSEEFATRSAQGEFQWQHTKDNTVHRFDYDGDLVAFSNGCVDQMVTPNHRMLVRRIPDKAHTSPTRWHDWHIRRADYFVDHPTAEFQLPVTTTWAGMDPPGPDVTLPADGARSVVMPWWAWAQFLGIYVAEGWTRPAKDGKNRWEVTVSQFPGGDLDAVQRILKDTGLNWRYDAKRGKFTVGCKALWLALQECGHGAAQKRLPSYVMDWTPTLLQPLLDGLLMGDGHVTASNQQIYTTTSDVLAGQLQELWQKLGMHAWVREGIQGKGSYSAGRRILTVRSRPESAFRVPRPQLTPYQGVVSCVSVPNGIIYVRRNGKPAWSGNTEGSIPAGFMEAPPDASNPDALAEWQETWDNLVLGDQAKLRQVRWVPSGSKFAPVHGEGFDDKFPLYLMRRVCAAFGVTPNDLGFTDNVNRASSETQVDVQFRVGTLPVIRHIEDVLNRFIQDDLKMRVEISFDTGQEKDDRLQEAQAMKTYIDAAVLSPDEVRKTIFGYSIDLDRPVGRSFDNSRIGRIPTLALESVQGKIDPETYGSDKSQAIIDHPFVPALGVMPMPGTSDAQSTLNAVDQAQLEQRAALLGKPQPTIASGQLPDGFQTPPQSPVSAVTPTGGTPPPSSATAKPGATDPGGAKSAAESNQTGVKKDTDGLTVATGVEGVDLLGTTSLVPGAKKRKKGKKRTQNAVLKDFVSAAASMHDRLAQSAERVDAAQFGGVGKARTAPEIHVHPAITVEAAPQPDIHVHNPITVEAAPQPDIHVHNPVTVEAQPAPVVNVAAPIVHTPPVTVNVPKADVHVHPPAQQRRRTRAVRNPDGSVSVETEPLDNE